MEINNYKNKCKILFIGEKGNDKFIILTISYIKYQDDLFFKITYGNNNNSIYIKDVDAANILSETLISYIKENTIKNTQNSSCILEIYIEDKQILVDEFLFDNLNNTYLKEIKRLKECISCYIKSIPYFKYINIS